MKYLMAIGIFFLSFSGFSQNPVELGKIAWERDYNVALEKAAAENKPIFLLFQEVPGCSTCRNYGQNVLSHGLVVDAIENEFIPLAIHNNKGGHDADVLELYNEPSWNNPVVRIIDKNGDNIIGRVAGNYSAGAVAGAMVRGLERSKKSVPTYLTLLNDELNSSGKDLAQKTYQMYCFWSGEGHLGNVDGVIKTAPGFMNGREVVTVVYDKKEISESKLDKYAKKASCSPVKEAKFTLDKDPQYYLKKSKYKHLPLSPMQRTKINSAIANDGNPKDYLSPTQLKWLENLGNNKKRHPEKYSEDLAEAWWTM